VADSGKAVLARARWDADNSLFDIDTDSTAKQYYRYDAHRRRIASLELTGSKVIADSRRYIYDDWQVVEERLFNDGATLGDAPSRLERIYVNGREIDRPLLTAIDRNGDRQLGGPAPKNVPDASADQEYYFLDNRPGSVMALLDADNADRILEYYRYAVYGDPTVLTVRESNGDLPEDTPLDLSDNNGLERKRTSSEFGNVYLFTGRRFDAQTGLYYYRNRYYEPVSGRFLSRDLFLGYESELSLYPYVRNGPTNHIDPMGTINGDLDEMIDNAKNGLGKELGRIFRPVERISDLCAKKPKTRPVPLPCASTPAALTIRKQKGHSFTCSWALEVAENKALAKCPPLKAACTGGCAGSKTCVPSVVAVKKSYARSIFDCKARLFFICPCACI
jgi:RHS repeat-associated protein